MSLLSRSPLQRQQKSFLSPCKGAAPIFNWIQTACSHMAVWNPSLASTQCPEALSLACSLAQLPPSIALHPLKLQHCLSQWSILSTNKSCCREPWRADIQCYSLLAKATTLVWYFVVYLHDTYRFSLTVSGFLVGLRPAVLLLIHTWK